MICLDTSKSMEEDADFIDENQSDENGSDSSDADEEDADTLPVIESSWQTEQVIGLTPSALLEYGLTIRAFTKINFILGYRWSYRYSGSI